MAAFFSSKKKDDWFLDAEQREYLKKTFSQVLQDQVAINIYTDDEKNPYSEFTINFIICAVRPLPSGRGYKA